MNLSAKKDQVTVCKGDTCLTVAGEMAKVLAIVLIIGIAAGAVSQVVKLLK